MVKALRRFIRGRRDRIESKGEKMEYKRAVAPEEELHWPSDTEESVFASEVEEDLEV